MDLHVLHEARSLARLTGRTPPACDALACRLGSPDRVAAAWVEGNPLRGDWLAWAEVPASRLMCWSGSLAEDPFGVHPANWLRPGRAALDAFVTTATPVMEARGLSLCLRPHTRHVLGDAQGCLRFLADHAGLPVQVAMSPADMLAGDMLGDLPEHLLRMFASLGPRAALLLLEDIRPAAEGDLPERVPLGQGVLPRELVLDLLRAHVPPETPVVVRPQSLAEQLAWLGQTA